MGIGFRGVVLMDRRLADIQMDDPAVACSGKSKSDAWGKRSTQKGFESVLLSPAPIKNRKKKAEESEGRRG